MPFILSAAKTGDGCRGATSGLVALLPEGPLYFPAGAAHRPAGEVQIAELVREQALSLTKEELPHAITVEVQEPGRR